MLTAALPTTVLAAPVLFAHGVASGDLCQTRLPPSNPHVRWTELDGHGFCVVDITPQRCRADWYHLTDRTKRDSSLRWVAGFSAYGYPFQRVWSEPDYFPLDEAHPVRPQDPYGLSKQAGEQIAQAYARAGSGTAVSLRFSHLVNEQTVPQWCEVMHDRPRHAAECLWSHVYDDDVAEACLRCLTAEVDGHVALLLTAATTLAPKPTDQLLDEFYPSVARRPGSHSHWSLVDCSLAAATIGWEPR